MYFEELYVFCDSIFLLLQKFLSLNHILNKQLKHTVNVSQIAKDQIETLLLRDPGPYDGISYTAEHVFKFTQSLRQILLETLPTQLFSEPPRFEEPLDLPTWVFSHRNFYS